MDDIDLSIYDFYEKYKGGAKLPPTIRIVLCNAIWLQENRESKEFPEGYCVEAEKYRTRIIDGCEKLMLLTEDENDCKDFVKYFATTRHNRESVLSEKDRESKGKFLGTLGQDIKNAQTCAADIYFFDQPGLFFTLLPGLLFLLMALAMLFVPKFLNWFLDPAVESYAGQLVGFAAVAMFIVCGTKLSQGSFSRFFLFGFGCAVATMIGLSFLIGLLDGMSNPGPYVLAIFVALCTGVALWLLISSIVKYSRISAYNRKSDAKRDRLLSELDKLLNYAQTCEDRAKYLKLNTYFEWRLEEYSDLVQYYTDAVNTLKDIRNSLT